MNLVVTEHLYAAAEELRTKRPSRDRLHALCLVLIDECTPYLGGHQKVERAFEEFVSTRKQTSEKSVDLATK